MQREDEDSMTPKRRFLSGLFGGRVDRTPVGNVISVATVEQMQMTGSYFPEAHTNPEKMAKLAAGGYEILGFDTIMPYFGLWLEGEALGCEVNWGDQYKLPDGIARGGLYKEPDEVRIPNDFLERRGPRALLDAIGILRDEYGDRVAIVGKVMGPWTLSYHVAGIKNVLMSTILKPDRVKGFIKVLKEVTVEFGRAQAKAGVDVLMLADHATGDLVSASTYRDFLLETHREITKRIGCPMVLHICGDTTDRLPYISQAGFDCFNFDSKVDAFKAREIVKGKISLLGNVNNPKTLLFGKPEDVKRETYYCMKAGVELVGPECAIPTRVRNENLKAIVEASREYARAKEG